MSMYLCGCVRVFLPHKWCIKKSHNFSMREVVQLYKDIAIKNKSADSTFKSIIDYDFLLVDIPFVLGTT